MASFLRSRRFKLQGAFSALRDLALLRPPVRPDALDMLLSLSTHTGVFRAGPARAKN
jgi:hypothetical protein